MQKLIGKKQKIDQKMGQNDKKLQDNNDKKM